MSFARRIGISLEHWDRSEIDFQEEVICRHKCSDAPISKTNECDSPDVDRVDADRNPPIVDNPPSGSERRRSRWRADYSHDGVRFTAERWPLWRQGMMHDAGLFFICYQRDPREGFIKIYENIAKLDALDQFTSHTGSNLFASAGRIGEDEFVRAEIAPIR